MGFILFDPADLTSGVPFERTTNGSVHWKKLRWIELVKVVRAQRLLQSGFGRSILSAAWP